ncbi:DnaJ subfamily C member 10 [Blattella germanica]|nr:DnaJ subfamily C member 10 [Blattella germanica]
MVFLNLQLIVVLLCFTFSIGEDYYELLGVPKTANNREIRKAFKKLAVTLHPDKNQADPDAHATFVRLTKAYEVLKDAESRKKYDLYGEDDFKSTSQQSYHSWSYYHDNFGIYDDDPEIVTLNKADFAPAWRRLARELEGVVRIGAVNCEEDWVLCRQEAIRSYPSLYVYPNKEKFNGDRNEDEMMRFILSRLKASVVSVNADLWENHRGSSPWLLIACHGESSTCLDSDSQVKLAAMLRLGSGDSGLIYWEPLENHPEGVTHKIMGSDAKEISKEVLSFLSEPSTLDEIGFEDMRNELKMGSPYPWVVYFFIGEITGDAELELKKLPALLPEMRLGKVHCGRWSGLCQELHIARYPLFAVFKPGGGYEIHHGRETAHDVANFARDSSAAPNIRVITPPEFPDLVHKSHENGAWLVDFYAPWCPPCMRLLPELRKASRQFDSTINFGTIDCTIHAAFCRQHNIRSYPTTILYNNTQQQQFLGEHTVTSVVDFLQDFLNPTVVKLTEKSFYSSVGKKTPDEGWLISLHHGVDHVNSWHQNGENFPSFIPSPVEELTPNNFESKVLNSEVPWLVDFYAPWCGHCVVFAPEFHIIAKVLKKSRIYVNSYFRLVQEVNIYVPTIPYFQNHYNIQTISVLSGVSGYPTVMLYYGNDRHHEGEEIPSQSADRIISHTEAVLSRQHQESRLPHDEF